MCVGIILFLNAFYVRFWANSLFMQGLSVRYGVDSLWPCDTMVNNSLWPSDAIWRQRSGSTLAQVMACCLTAPSHYLNQCWLINKVQWHLSEGNFTTDTSAMGLLPDQQNCRLHMRQEWRERFPSHRIQRKPVVSDLGMHHGTCVTHGPWCMSGSLTRGGLENIPGIPGACATHNITYLVRGPWII